MQALAQLLERISFTQEQLSGSVTEIQSRYDAGSEFDFKMLVPAQWTLHWAEGFNPEKGGNPSLLLRVAPGEQATVELRVWCAVLEREMNPVDCAELFVRATGGGFVDFTNHRTSYGILADALLHSPDPKLPGTSRLYTVKDGDRLFLLEARASADDPQHVHLMQNVFLLAQMSFELREPTKERFAEPFEIEALAGSGPLPYFLKPESWETKPMHPVPDQGDALVLENGGSGSIVITAVPDPHGANWLEGWVHAIFAHGQTHLGELGRAHAVVPNTDYEMSLRSAVGVIDSAVEMTCLISKFENSSTSGAVGLLTPSEESSLIDYAINRRAFEVLLESLTPHS